MLSSYTDYGNRYLCYMKLFKKKQVIQSHFRITLKKYSIHHRYLQKPR